MTIFDLSGEEQGDWFEFFTSHIEQGTGKIIYDEPEENSARFQIRSPAPFWEERRKGRKKESQFVLNPATRAMERVTWYKDLPEDQDRKEIEDAWDYTITGIEDAFWGPDDPIECTRENKLKLIRMPVFDRFLSRVLQLISETGVKQEEAAEKNL